jgi:hypothetical protein
VAAENRAGVSAYSENTMAVKPLEKIGVWNSTYIFYV